MGASMCPAMLGMSAPAAKKTALATGDNQYPNGVIGFRFLDRGAQFGQQRLRQGIGLGTVQRNLKNGVHALDL